MLWGLCEERALDSWKGDPLLGFANSDAQGFDRFCVFPLALQRDSSGTAPGVLDDIEHPGGALQGAGDERLCHPRLSAEGGDALTEGDGLLLTESFQHGFARRQASAGAADVVRVGGGGVDCVCCRHVLVWFGLFWFVLGRVFRE